MRSMPVYSLSSEIHHPKRKSQHCGLTQRELTPTTPLKYPLRCQITYRAAIKDTLRVFTGVLVARSAIAMLSVKCVCLLFCIPHLLRGSFSGPAGSDTFVKNSALGTGRVYERRFPEAEP
jgi:hypothetical protein